MKVLLKEAIDRVELLTMNLPTVVDPASISLQAKIPTKVLCYREAMIWRTEELTRSACHHFESDDLASAITLTRAAIEGIAATWYLKASVEKVVKSGSVGAFDERIMRLLLGSKNDISDLNAFNALDFIDSVDKASPGFRRTYESLCEYAHPNWSGTSQLFSKVDHEQVLTEFGRNKRNTEGPRLLGLQALIASLTIYEHAYNAIGDLLPEFIVVCEADVKKLVP